MDMMDYDFPEEGQDAQTAGRTSPSRARGRRSGLSDLTGTFLSNPLYIAIAAFVVGMLFGWMVIGWGLWPVKWENASPFDLHQDYQLDYMRMTIDSFNLRQDLNLAKERINALGEAGPVVLQKLVDNPGDMISQLSLQLFLQQYAPGQSLTPGQPTAVPGEGTGEEQPSKSAGTNVMLLAACAVMGVAAVALGVLYFLKTRGRKPMGKTAAMRAQEFSRQAPQTDYSALGEEAPVAQWMTTYLIGDDLFDDSFSIDSLNGEFLGECGVGIADTIGVGEPKRVSAFEVWLFDKNDIQTVTKVLMSGHAYNDEGIHNRLSAKGEPFLAVPDGQVVLETKTLRMVVRVMDMEYGTGHLPENSFFQRITLELAVWMF